MADETFKQDFLEAHNAYRALHGVPPLTYNKELCDKAQEWAESCLQNKCLSHSKTDDGENVYSKSGFPKVTTTGKEAVEAWYSEIKDYNFAKPGFQSGTGHFTQVVWKNSTELGVGMATDGKSVFVVGQYRPAGNFTNKGEFEGNVLPKN
ncbi:Golgi-associated plant pathogenesis-related protein 1 [Oryzias melastigma]|uniref:Golgi-associated plant pathogenesis-related protein 1 n=1 Tax=Oryzias melastigma TaxID=30732 RepID=UPI000CF821ED|nr:Golgi-associated plant pathogenesis-related protein 1 [Oryzias melastigma]XP_024131591.1 Golgi-associated plant pathogenesis-related protein 1 [Oryzias melastigma]